MSTVIPFGEWLPDLPPYGLNGATVATNVLPDAESYRPFPQLVPYTTSVGARVVGGIYATDPAGNNYNYAATGAALYALTGSSFSDATRLVGGGYTTNAEEYWEFANWGNTVIGVNGLVDLPQRISLGALNFADMSIGVKAKHIATMRDFLVLGNVSDSAANVYRVRWSAINNPTSFTADAATLADYQDLPSEGGIVQRIVGGEYGVIFQQRRIWRMTFVGSPLIFQFDPVHNKIGALVPQCVANYQNLVFFLSEDGFYTFDGSQLNPIGRSKVDKFFRSDLNPSYIQRIIAAIDPINKYVMWAYVSNDAPSTNPDKLLVYSWAFDRWTIVQGLNVEYILSMVTTGYTLDGLDAITTNLDLLPFSLDSLQWTGGTIVAAAFNSEHVLGRFNGSAMAATVTTREFMLYQDQRAMITEVRPVVHGLSASTTITLVNRNTLTESASVGSSATVPNATGFVQTRCSARYFKIQLNTAVSVNFKQLTGVEVSGRPAGVR
jgi:hypothetical protein